MSFAQKQIEDRRGIILRALHEDAEFRLAQTSLRRVVDLHGHMVSMAELHADLEWLERAGLVRVDRQELAQGEFWVVQLLEDGQLVARGRSHPGVGRQDFAPSR